MQQLNKIVNPQTGSEFSVISTDSTYNMLGAIRFWVMPELGTKNAVICFRYRVVKDGGMKSASMENECKKAYPKAKWTGGSNIHGSTVGAITTKFPGYQVDNILSALTEGDVGGSLYDALQAVFETMRFIFDRKGFINYFMEEVERMLKGDPALTSKAVVIDFMGYKKEVNGPIQIAEPKETATSTLAIEEQSL